MLENVPNLPAALQNLLCVNVNFGKSCGVFRELTPTSALPMKRGSEVGPRSLHNDKGLNHIPYDAQRYVPLIDSAFERAKNVIPSSPVLAVGRFLVAQSRLESS